MAEPLKKTANKLLIRALKGEALKSPPIWLIRTAISISSAETVRRADATLANSLIALLHLPDSALTLWLDA
jgi:uroporphyrinogen-III decarboxylase